MLVLLLQATDQKHVMAMINGKFVDGIIYSSYNVTLKILYLVYERDFYF